MASLNRNSFPSRPFPKFPPPIGGAGIAGKPGVPESGYFGKVRVPPFHFSPYCAAREVSGRGVRGAGVLDAPPLPDLSGEYPPFAIQFLRALAQLDRAAACGLAAALAVTHCPDWPTRRAAALASGVPVGAFYQREPADPERALALLDAVLLLERFATAPAGCRQPIGD